MNTLFAIATGIMFGMGIFQILRRDLIKAAMGFYILFAAINLLFLSVGAYDGLIAAYVDANGQTVSQTSDPLVQALILTAIVISFGSYALLLGLIVISSRRFRTVDSDEVDHLKG
jgi:multicomponent Na+:H+ antiporter subunit C